MKRLWLVGESLPLKSNGDPKDARQSKNLPDRLVPLDPRHGVFPNLVMKPLCATAYSLSKSTDDEDLLSFFREIDAVLRDTSERRLNVFKDRIATPKKHDGKRKHPAAKDIFEIDEEDAMDRMAQFSRQRDLWLVFGHQTNFGLLAWLVNGKKAATTRREDIKQFSLQFVSAAYESMPTHPPHKPTTLSGRVGLLHMLCTGRGTRQMLTGTVTRLKPSATYSVDRIVGFLRATVPLLHNEGYQDASSPTGNAQNHFVRSAVHAADNGDLYWQVMGHAIAKRMRGEYIK